MHVVSNLIQFAGESANQVNSNTLPALHSQEPSAGGRAIYWITNPIEIMVLQLML